MRARPFRGCNKGCNNDCNNEGVTSAELRPRKRGRGISQHMMTHLWAAHGLELDALEHASRLEDLRKTGR
jgi:hypothetical protein